jgi:phage gpG-like protein
MSRPIISIDAKELEQALARYSVKARAIRMSIFEGILLNAVDEVFQTKGYNRWPELSPSTLARHPRRQGGKLLQDTGLLSNIQTRSGALWAEAESPAAYGIYHVTGTKHMPARDYLNVKEGEMLETMARVVLAQIAS